MLNSPQNIIRLGMKLGQLKREVLKNRQVIINRTIKGINCTQIHLQQMSLQKINSQFYFMIAKRSFALSFAILLNLYEAQKGNFSFQTLAMMKDIYNALATNWFNSIFIAIATVIRKDLKFYKQFIIFSEVLTGDNIQFIAQTIRDQLFNVEKMIRGKIILMQQWLERQNQIAYIFIEIENSHLNIQLKKYLNACFKRTILQNQPIINDFIVRQFNNESFWLNEFDLFTLKLKEIIYSLRQQNQKLKVDNESQKNKEANNLIEARFYKIYQPLKEDVRNIGNKIVFLKEQYSQWMRHQKSIRGTIACQNEAINKQNIFILWQQNISSFEKLMQLFVIGWEHKLNEFKNIDDHGEQVDIID